MSKRYGATHALRDATLTLRASEVHVLLGANGAGKSTLIKVLAGVTTPDSGTLELAGHPVTFSTPLDAATQGVATVFQELSLFPRLTVAQNILIGREPRGRGRLIDEQKLQLLAAQTLARLQADHIPVGAYVENLSLADQQLVEIAKALSHDPQLLILDEATSALSSREVNTLLNLVTQLSRAGMAVLFISHRMEEIERIADRVTILRDGAVVESYGRADFQREAAVSAMLGHRAGTAVSTRTPLGLTHKSGPPTLDVEQLSLPGVLTDIQFRLGAGEILGLSGLEGQGQVALMHALFGLYRRGVEGRVTLLGVPGLPSSPWAAMRRGVAYIPEDRKTQGGFLPLSIQENMTINSLPDLSRAGVIDPARVAARCREMIQILQIKVGSVHAPLSSLSGGNQQKVIVAKWLARAPRLLLFNDPTRGIDIGAKAAMFELIAQQAAQGCAVIFYSTDLSEFAGLCDRVLVLRDGTIGGEIPGAEISEARILALAFGEAAPQRVPA
ncbi:sugar ABC transporter ATP-binding protein [Deinococcus sp. SM5_A1]|uniref:sugar ABC transporter ATP-binding protein n=1 Tax=Deinococcus sp. SM5_A1 TaxID=3379094 RepID=UPI00385C96CA